MKTETLFDEGDLASRIYQAFWGLVGFRGDAMTFQGEATRMARKWFAATPLAMPTRIGFVTNADDDPAYWRSLIDCDLIVVLDADTGAGMCRVVHPIPRSFVWKAN